MSDEHAIERAEKLYDDMLQHRIKEQRAKVPIGMGDEFCDCGNDIPHKRRELGYSSCIECATLRDKRNAQHRR